jgi:LEA14-like dessication related protein
MSLRVACFVGVLCGVPACSKPKPPELAPKEVTIASVDLRGFDFRLKLDAFNPNGFPLSVKSVAAHVVVDGNQDLGTVTGTQPISLPPNAHTTLDVPLNVKWTNIGTVLTIAAARRPVPFVIDGLATVGGDTLTVDVPFTLRGTMTPEQLQQATTKSIQNIPGLSGLPGLAPPRGN